MDDGKMNFPKELRCAWRLARKDDFKEQPQMGRGVYFCPDCGCWTANLPLYRYNLCGSKDRRKALNERRGVLVKDAANTDAKHDADGDMYEALTRIKAILVNELDEPVRRAFWEAVHALAKADGRARA